MFVSKPCVSVPHFQNTIFTSPPSNRVSQYLALSFPNLWISQSVSPLIPSPLFSQPPPLSHGVQSPSKESSHGVRSPLRPTSRFSCVMLEIVSSKFRIWVKRFLLRFFLSRMAFLQGCCGRYGVLLRLGHAIFVHSGIAEDFGFGRCRYRFVAAATGKTFRFLKPV